MKVDYHVHLEEGPYSFRWLDRTNKALTYFSPSSEQIHSKEWLHESYGRLHHRLTKGAYHESWIDLYLQEAKRKGLKEVGIVDHLYRFQETKDYFEKYMDISDTELGRLQHEWLQQVMTENMSDFTEAITEAKERWAKEGVTLRLGIEADYFVGGEEELASLLAGHPWDYVIGSVHFLNGWGFDNPDTKKKFEGLDLIPLYDDFYTVVEKAIRSNLFDFVAHLDNMKVFNYRPDETRLLPHYEKIARALIDTNTATEINAGLYYRYPVKEMCPSITFLDVLLKHGVAITTSSDSHYPDDIGNYIDDNTTLLMEKERLTVATFYQRKRTMKEL